jgi:sugar O-acyltransferase (sialic acid O-acetyltransferase NeuD family)
VGRLIGVFGASGFGREILPLVRRQIAENGANDKIVFVEATAGPARNGTTVIADPDFLGDRGERAFVVAIADGPIRKRLHEQALLSGAKPLDIRSPSADILDEVTLGAGYILCGHSTVSSNSQVGDGFHLNISSYLAHDCVVGNFVTFGPNVVCAGNVVVEDMAYIGAGAMIRQGTPDKPLVIGAGAVVGMGAVVTESVPRGVTVIGNPARPLDAA